MSSEVFREASEKRPYRPFSLFLDCARVTDTWSIAAMNHRYPLAIALFIGLSATFNVLGAEGNTPVWTAPQAETLPSDFKIQGEYAATGIGVQVIALGEGQFQEVIYPGVLPGSGWNKTDRSLMSGSFKGRRVVFKPTEGNRKYLAADAESFSASKNYLPAGHQSFSGTINRQGRRLTLNTPSGLELKLNKTARRSATLGMPAPDGARQRFNGQDTNAFSGGRLDEGTHLLNTDGKDIRTKDAFQNYSMHIEFMLPFRPDARGQGRGNSGFYQVDHYELQILDSFGLEGVNNECGGFYTKAAPSVNMCLPPLQWQTYDVEFTNAVREDDRKVKNAVVTVWHNGVKIHDNLEINGKTGGSRSAPEGTPGPIKLQGHGNPLQFRNIWVLEKTE